MTLGKVARPDCFPCLEKAWLQFSELEKAWPASEMSEVDSFPLRQLLFSQVGQTKQWSPPPFPVIFAFEN